MKGAAFWRQRQRHASLAALPGAQTGDSSSAHPSLVWSPTAVLSSRCFGRRYVKMGIFLRNAMCNALSPATPQIFNKSRKFTLWLMRLGFWEKSGRRLDVSGGWHSSETALAQETGTGLH